MGWWNGSIVGMRDGGIGMVASDGTVGMVVAEGQNCDGGRQHWDDSD